MFLAVQRQFEHWNASESLSVSHNIYQLSKARGLNPQTWTVLEQWYPSWSKSAFLIFASIAKGLMSRYVDEAAIEIVLDASGFFYSDHWQVSSMERRLRLYQDLRSKGKKIILLPQALGPFETRERSEIFSKIVSLSDRIYARDHTSQTYAREIASPDLAERIHCRPDFTNLLEPVESSLAKQFRGRACVVPNTRMLDKTPPNFGTKYVDYMVTSIKKLHENNLSPYMLLFELHDTTLAAEIKSKLAFDVPIIQLSDPLLLKGILRTARFVIASRYHSLISALSSGVPSLCLGWTHKYESLMSDYESEHLQVTLEEVSTGSLDKLEWLLDRTDEESDRLQLVAEKQKERTIEFWNELKPLITAQPI
jgi:Uncharacterized conserved protein